MNMPTGKILRFWEKHKSSHVFVGSLAISRLAENLKKCPPTVPDWRIPEVLPESNEAFVSHIFYICAVDFAFTHFEPPYEKYQITNQKIPIATINVIDNTKTGYAIAL